MNCTLPAAGGPATQPRRIDEAGQTALSAPMGVLRLKPGSVKAGRSQGAAPRTGFQGLPAGNSFPERVNAGGE
jgi:hypothetical protein